MSHDHIHTTVKDVNLSRFDTKSKILISISLISCLLLAVSFEQLVFFAILSIVLGILYRIDVKSLLLKTLVPLPLIFSLALLAYISYRNNGEVSFSTVTILYERFELSSFYFLRSLLLVIVTLLLIESEDSFFEVIYALEEMKVPPVLINILLIMYRTILDLQQEGKRLLDARYSRSPKEKWKTSLFTYRVLGYMIGGVLARALLRKDQRRDALISRGFKGKLHHRHKYFTFNGLLLLWLTVIASLIIVLQANLKFLPIGELEQ